MIPLLALLLGLIIGSFLNVCIHRWPRDESVVRPGSHCPRCRKALSWYDNIPLVSYLMLRGQCRYCSAPISFRYPIVELLNGFFYFYLASRFGWQLSTAKMAVFVSMMLVLIFTDIADYILPDEITLGGLGAGLLLSPFVHVDARSTQLFWALRSSDPAPWVMSLVESAFAAAFVGGFLYALRATYFRLRHIEGLGLGDVKMMAMVGAFWGLSTTIGVLLIGSLVGAVTGSVIVLIARKKWTYELPFGAYLGAGSIMVVVWGADLHRWWMSVIT